MEVTNPPGPSIPFNHPHGLLQLEPGVVQPYVRVIPPESDLRALKPDFQRLSPFLQAPDLAEKVQKLQYGKILDTVVTFGDKDGMRSREIKDKVIAPGQPGRGQQDYSNGGAKRKPAGGTNLAIVL